MKLYKGNKGRNMLSFIRRRVTYANVAMTLALVFAMTGGAYALNGNGSSVGGAHATAQIAKKKSKPKVQRGPRGPKGETGKTGPAGPVGPVGPAGLTGAVGAVGPAGLTGAVGPVGPAGPTGPAGPVGPAGTGTPGTNGVSVTSKEQATGTLGPCKAGGSEFKSASPTPTYACNGEGGSGGVPIHLPKTLASGDSLTGMWATGSQGEVSKGVTVTPQTEEIETEVKGVKKTLTVVTSVGEVQEGSKPVSNVAISFPIPFEAGKTPKVAVQLEKGAELAYLLETGKFGVLSNTSTPSWSEACSGTFEKPTAAKGYLCVYVNEGQASLQASLIEEGHEFGARIPFVLNASTPHADGSWAVTAE